MRARGIGACWRLLRPGEAFSRSPRNSTGVPHHRCRITRSAAAFFCRAAVLIISIGLLPRGAAPPIFITHGLQLLVCATPRFKLPSSVCRRHCAAPPMYHRYRSAAAVMPCRQVLLYLVCRRCQAAPLSIFVTGCRRHCAAPPVIFTELPPRRRRCLVYRRAAFPVDYFGVTAVAATA